MWWILQAPLLLPRKIVKILLLITSQQSMLEQKEPSIPSYWGKIEELTTAKISIFAE